MDDDYFHELTLSEFWGTCVEPNGYERISVDEVAWIISSLKTEGHIMPKAGRWKQLVNSKTSVAQRLQSRKAQVASIVEAVVAAAAANTYSHLEKIPRRCLFECRNSAERLSAIPSATYHVDAISYKAGSSCTNDTRSGCAQYSMLRSTRDGSLIDTAGVLASWHVSLELSPCPELYSCPREKTFEVARHLMSADLRRTCHYSITLEGTTARLWRYCRTWALYSEPFDINKNKEEFIQWILFTSYASDTQLGLDPTVTRVVDKHGQWQYQFDVLTADNMVRTYQTIKALSPDRYPDSPFDRAMHVFEVQRVTTKGCGDSFSTVDTNTYALQDYWRSDVEGRNSETRSQRKLYGALKAHTSSADELREVWAHFMEFLADGVVRWEDMRACAPAPDIPAKPYDYEEGGLSSSESEEGDTACQSEQEEASGASAEISSCESCEEGSESSQADNNSVARLRHRTLHAHVCVDLYQVNEPAVFFFALDKAVFVLSWLRRIGWLHRDISSGNLMLRRLLTTSTDAPLHERYQLKLHDLEYSLEYAEAPQPDDGVGTNDFAAVEMATQKYMFAHTAEPSALPKTCASERPSGSLVFNIAFHRNFFHDLESTAWIAMEFALSFIPRRRIQSDDWPCLWRSLIGSMLDFRGALFPKSRTEIEYRVEMLTEPATREEVARVLRNVYGADSPVSKIPDLFAKLREAYDGVENKFRDSDVPIGDGDAPSERRLPASLFENYAEIYDVFRATFQELSNYYALEEGKKPLVELDHFAGKMLDAANAMYSDEQPPTAQDTEGPSQAKNVEQPPKPRDVEESPIAEDPKAPTQEVKATTKKRKVLDDATTRIGRPKRARK
ncbi:hypothetical protein K525DRAFT_205332 [Schizophyllum commune Loenen D]|nr:hypothetical protein K525DRAFT_205332 [Schizophyllum commune Loenen D]